MRVTHKTSFKGAKRKRKTSLSFIKLKKKHYKTRKAS